MRPSAGGLFTGPDPFLAPRMLPPRAPPVLGPGAALSPATPGGAPAPGGPGPARGGGGGAPRVRAGGGVALDRGVRLVRVVDHARHAHGRRAVLEEIRGGREPLAHVVFGQQVVDRPRDAVTLRL